MRSKRGWVGREDFGIVVDPVDTHPRSTCRLAERPIDTTKEPIDVFFQWSMFFLLLLSYFLLFDFFSLTSAKFSSMLHLDITQTL